MTTRVKLEIAAAVLAVVIGALALREHDNHVRVQAVADATQSVQNQVIKQAGDYIKVSQAQVEKLTKALQQEQTNNASLKAQLIQKYQKTQAPAEIATLHGENIGAKQGEVKAGGTKENPTITAPAQLTKQYDLECETCKLNAKSLTAQMSYAEQIRHQQINQLSKKDETIGGLKQTNDMLVTANKGGTWIKRTFKTLKVVACAGAGAAAGGTKGSVPAAIGAVGGAVVCSLF